MSTVELFAVRTFLIWNITVRTDTVFEISEGIAKELIQRGVCITMDERQKRLAEKAKKKAEKEASPQPKKTRKSKDAEVSA